MVIIPSVDLILTNSIRWCGNVYFPDSSPYKGLVLHIEIQFTDNYPTEGPKLKVLSDFNHTHVSKTTCIDLISLINLYIDIGIWTELLFLITS